MSPDAPSAEAATSVTAFVDIQAPPPEDQPTAFIIFGTNQITAATRAIIDRYRRGLAPLIIASGGVNRHTGIIEGRAFLDLLSAEGIPQSAIRYEDKSADTWQNVEFTLPFLREALDANLPITAVSKWFHRRTLHILKTLLPDIGRFHGIGWEPSYASTAITRTSWTGIPDGHRRVIREWEEVQRRVTAGELAPVKKIDGAWI